MIGKCDELSDNISELHYYIYGFGAIIWTLEVFDLAELNPYWGSL